MGGGGFKFGRDAKILAIEISKEKVKKKKAVKKSKADGPFCFFAVKNSE